MKSPENMYGISYQEYLELTQPLASDPLYVDDIARVIKNEEAWLGDTGKDVASNPKFCQQVGRTLSRLEAIFNNYANRFEEEHNGWNNHD